MDQIIGSATFLQAKPYITLDTKRAGQLTPLRGDTYLRTLIIHGARATLRTAKYKEDRQSRWVIRIAQNRHPYVAAVALTKKTDPIAWAMMEYGTDR